MAGERQGGPDRQAEQLGRQVLDMLEARGAGGAAGAGAYGRGRQAGGWLYGLAVGFAVGVLVATVLVPDDGGQSGAPVASEVRGGESGSSAGTSRGGATSGGGEAPGVAPPRDDGEVAGGEAGEPSGFDSAGPAPAGGGGGSDTGQSGSGSTSGGEQPAGEEPAGEGSTTGGGESPAPVATATAAKGVTEDTIKLGILAPSENPRTGNLHEAYEAEVDRWRQEGLLPVHGRDVELVHYEYELVTEREGPAQRAACVNLADEEEVFAVLAWIVEPAAADCLATEFQTPVIASITAFDQDLVDRASPYFFHTGMVRDRVLRNWPHWAHEFGYLEDRTIGLYYSDDSQVKAQIDGHFRPVLQQLGYSVEEEQAATEGQGADTIAVQRFEAAGVDTVFLMLPDGQFSRAAEAQGYRPRYLLSDFEEAAGTSDTAPVSYGWVPEQFDNAYAMTYWRRGETGRSEQEPVPSAGEECMENYFEYSGRRYDKSDPSESGTYDAHQPTCDQGKAMIKALHEAGRGLGESELVRGLETAVKSQPSGAVADISFSSTSHDGASQFKTNQGDGDCFCWLQVQGFRAPWVD